LLALKRGHWRIENSLHRPKDVALGEYASLLHTANGPDVLAILRNLALSLLHAAGIHTIAAQLRHFSAHPEEVLQFVLAFSTQNASTLCQTSTNLEKSRPFCYIMNFLNGAPRFESGQGYQRKSRGNTPQREGAHCS
jgi:hypothetical protein